MEKRLSPEEACTLVVEELSIDRSCIRACFDESGSRVCCLVHECWLQKYIVGVPSHDEPGHESPWSPYEHQLILQPSHPEPAAPWIRISIQVIKKPIKKAPLRKSFPDAFGSGVDNGGKFSVLSYAELMQCVGVHNFRHSWDSALDSYPLAAHCVLPAPLWKESDKNVVEEMLLQAYGLSARKLCPDAESSEHSNFGSSAERDAFDDFKEESEECCSICLCSRRNSAYFLIEPYFQHSLHNMVTFSPSVLSGSHMRPLFMIYELLHALHWYHSREIAHGALTLHKVKVSKGLWIYLESPDFLHTCNSEISLSEIDGVSCGTAASKPQLDINESLVSALHVH
ncbi:WD repeat-containing protein 81 [Desmophyllum pertusum]|uniref:WD repeat-containing protein 81 n=1 Tax=Desmophyllum pertusum TaxID=174260 RepID=A0A9W9Z955_9CNID|nr:WD repeat-containing protein 81 [Desmophyllum pertusum]